MSGGGNGKQMLNVHICRAAKLPRKRPVQQQAWRPGPHQQVAVVDPLEVRVLNRGAAAPLHLPWGPPHILPHPLPQREAHFALLPPRQQRHAATRLQVHRTLEVLQGLAPVVPRPRSRWRSRWCRSWQLRGVGGAPASACCRHRMGLLVLRGGSSGQRRGCCLLLLLYHCCRLFSYRCCCCCETAAIEIISEAQLSQLEHIAGPGPHKAGRWQEPTLAINGAAALGSSWRGCLLLAAANWMLLLLLVGSCSVCAAGRRCFCSRCRAGAAAGSTLLCLHHAALADAIRRCTSHKAQHV